MIRRNVFLPLLVLAVSACAAAPRPGPAAQPSGDSPALGDPRAIADADREAQLVPAGFGTLRQDDISMALRLEDLLIKVTPLDEAVIRLTAPDTYDRLRGVAESHRAAMEERTGARDLDLFLVSFFSYEPNVTYQPEDLRLVHTGLRSRPAAIQGITPGWGVQRLGQQEFQLAVYGFDDDIDLDVDLVVQYRNVGNSGWDRILPRVEAERGKVRARSGGP